MSFRRLLKNSGLFMTSRIINALIQVFCLPVLLKTYGKDDYGLIIIAMSLNTFVMIIQIGFPSGLPKFVAEWFAKDEKEILSAALRTVFSFYIIMALINCTALMGISIWGVSFFNINYNQVETLQLLLIITAVTSFFALPTIALDQVLIGAQDLGFVSSMEMLKNFLFLILVSVIFFNPDSMGIIEFYAIRCFLMFSMVPAKLWKWSKYESLISIVPGWNLPAVWPLLKYCISLSVFNIFLILSKKIPPVILAFRAKNSTGGVMADFQIIDYVGVFLLMISSAIITALVPHISKVATNGDIKVYKKLINEGTKVIWAFGALVGFGVFMLSKEVILLYVGPQYLHIKIWLEIYIVGLLYNLYNPAMSSVILSYGKLLPMVFATLIGCILSIFVSWSLAPIIGIGCIGISLIAFNVCAFTVNHFWYFPKFFDVKPLHQIISIFSPPVFAGIIMCVSGRWVISYIACSNLYINIGIGILTGTVIYLAIIFTCYIRPTHMTPLRNLFMKDGPAANS